MANPVSQSKLLTDIRELIEIVDRRLGQLRQNGPPDALRTMVDIRNWNRASRSTLASRQCQ